MKLKSLAIIAFALNNTAQAAPFTGVRFTSKERIEFLGGYKFDTYALGLGVQTAPQGETGFMITPKFTKIFPIVDNLTSGLTFGLGYDTEKSAPSLQTGIDMRVKVADLSYAVMGVHYGAKFTPSANTNVDPILGVEYEF